jgi:hypothetical protein
MARARRSSCNGGNDTCIMSEKVPWRSWPFLPPLRTCHRRRRAEPARRRPQHSASRPGSHISDVSSRPLSLQPSVLSTIELLGASINFARRLPSPVCLSPACDPCRQLVLDSDKDNDDTVNAVRSLIEPPAPSASSPPASTPEHCRCISRRAYTSASCAC